MNAATPTKECLELIYELLLPIMRARGEKNLTRQEVLFYNLQYALLPKTLSLVMQCMLVKYLKKKTF